MTVDKKWLIGINDVPIKQQLFLSEDECVVSWFDVVIWSTNYQKEKIRIQLKLCFVNINPTQSEILLLSYGLMHAHIDKMKGNKQRVIIIFIIESIS
jgi:hypothetical protein